MNNKKDKEIEVNDYSKLYEDAWNYFYNKKKLPENPFKETDKLAEKLTLDIADKTDKALIESLNDLIKAGILEIKVLQPHTEFHENCLTVKSGVQVVPKFDEYTKKLESENSELKKQLILLSGHERVRIQAGITDQLYIKELQKEIKKLKENSIELGKDCVRAEEEYEKLKSKYDSLTENLTAAMEAADFLNKFLKLEK